MPWVLFLAMDVTGTSTTDLKKLEKAESAFVDAYILYAGGNLPEASEGFQKVYKLFPREPIGAVAAYNTAFLHAKMGQPEDGLLWLEKAFASGYDNFEHVETDGDLALTRALPRYALVVQEARRKARPGRPPIRPFQHAGFARKIVDSSQNGDWIQVYALSSRLGWFSHAPTVEALNRLLDREGYQIQNQNGSWRVEKMK